MAGPARWYLAALGMLSLLLLAAHFSVQEHVQKNMRIAVHDWLQQSGGDVQHVRYRLLRGELTMDQLSWVNPGDASMRLDVSQVFVRTSSRAMLSRAPYFSELNMEHPVLSLRRETLLGWLRDDQRGGLAQLAGFLQRSGVVAVSDMSLLVSSGQDELPDEMLLHQLHGQFNQHGLRIEGQMSGGAIMLEAGLKDAGSKETGLKEAGLKDTGALSGRVVLGRVPLAALRLLSDSGDAQADTSSSAPDVAASGTLILSGNWMQRDVGMQGKLQLRDAQAVAALDVQGGWSATGADLNLACDNVPLAALPLAWPKIAGRDISAGRLAGTLHLARDWEQAIAIQQGWRIVLDGQLGGVVLSAVDLPAWRIRKVDLTHAVLLSDAGSFVASGAHLEDADIILRAFDDPDGIGMAEPVGLTDESAKLIQGGMEDDQGLPERSGVESRLQIGKLSLQGIRPQLMFADGSSIALPVLQGSGMLVSGKSGKGRISLVTPPADVEEAENGAQEKWKIQAEGDVVALWQIKVNAVYVPVVRLRALLPDILLPGEQAAPEYTGFANLALQLEPGPQGLQARGHVRLMDMRMSQGSDQLSAKRIDVEIDAAGSDGRRSLTGVAIDGWHYQMALRPMSRITRQLQSSSEASNLPQPEEDAVGLPAGGEKIIGVSESSAPMRGLNWEVGEILAKDGSISLGQPDALMAGQLLFRVHHLGSNRFSPFTLSGAFGEGDLHVQGKMQLQPGLRLNAKAEVSHALPFVFNDWMRLSGMPRFVRGRMDAQYSIADDGPALAGAYTGKLKIMMHQAAFEAGAFPDDPMLQRTGYSARGLLERLNASRQFSLSIPFAGAWNNSNLAGNIGSGVLAGLKKSVAKTPAARLAAQPPISKLTRLRLRGNRGFSYNERLRLKKMAKQLLAEPELIVELTPQLGTAQPDAEMRERVRQSQRNVGKYLRTLGVADKRIFPVWPQTTHQRGDAPGLLLQARMP